MLPFWMRLPNKNATNRMTGTSARMNRVRRAFNVRTITIEPTSETDLAEQRGEVAGQHGAHLGHVAGEARDNIADAPVGIKVEREALQVVV